MWMDILQHNREEILRALRQFQDELHAFQTALANRDYTEIRARLERGKAYGATVFAREPGDAGHRFRATDAPYSLGGSGAWMSLTWMPDPLPITPLPGRCAAR